jgi:hypothetical protein
MLFALHWGGTMKTKLRITIALIALPTLVAIPTELSARHEMLMPVPAVSNTETVPDTAAGTLQITSGNPPSGKVGKLYNVHCTQIPLCNVFVAGFRVAAMGGVQPYSWSWTAQSGSSLPPGLLFPDLSRYQCLNISPPAICGKPTTAGSYNVVITVKDSELPPRHASAQYTIHIFP